jgi:hypothetical protein
VTPETLVIDRTFKSVGRIKRASGTTDPKVRRKLSKMLTDLADAGRLDLLRAIRDGDLSLMEVHLAVQRKDVDSLPTSQTLRSLSETMETWIEAIRVPEDYSARHKGSLETSRRYFKTISAKAKVSDLPAILEKMREGLGRKHPRSFNLARSAALAFVRATLKRSHPLWLAIAAVEPRKVAKTTKRRPLTPDAMRGFFPNPDSDHLDALAWSMATTGMGQGELYGQWEVMSDRIHIVGTKREGRVRDVPLVFVPSVPRMHRRTLENKLRERTNRSIAPYDLRRTYANWMESAGIPRTRRRIYRGHGAQDIGDLYEAHEVEAFLKEDAAKISAFLKIVTTIPHTMKLVKEETA